ncbi:hypothetical protein BKG59_19475 [Mycobacteroides chelonae]|jgi:hypothetical protein|nr:hypothetical protein BKG63_22255 [Mycobacteroides chelonae]OHT99313.1 hypothetical protein BKG72_02385 [Mycobacteroides chelonae]OLT86071.1 hypothetical protein BKG59_19475 [Mycobacteroides chelonae]
MARMRIVRRRRPLAEALVAESGARRRAQERGEDPDECPEALAAAAQANLTWMLRQRISDTPEDYMPGFGDPLTD